MNIEHEDVWMRIFAQSLEGEGKKWLRDIPIGSIHNIEELDDTILK